MITGVIDWANASVGDYRFDVARTLNILETEAPKYVDSLILENFKKGWEQGRVCYT